MKISLKFLQFVLCIFAHLVVILCQCIFNLIVADIQNYIIQHNYY